MRRDDAYGTDDRAFIRVDLVGRTGDHVSARCRHVFSEGIDRQFLFLRQRANALVDERGLHGRTARRIDDERHRLHAPEREGRFERACDAGEVEPAAQGLRGADGAREPHHGDDGFRLPAGNDVFTEGGGKERRDAFFHDTLDREKAASRQAGLHRVLRRAGQAAAPPPGGAALPCAR